MEETIVSTSCIFIGSFLGAAPGMSDAFYVVNDFGDAIRFCRNETIDDEVESRLKEKPEEDVTAYREQVEHYFDVLLERFVREGYQPEIKKALQDGMDQFFLVYQLGIYVLPEDLSDLLESVGNPLTEDEDDEEGEATTASQPAFDLDNPEHCAALFNRLLERIS